MSHLEVCSSIGSPLDWFDPCLSFYLFILKGIPPIRDFDHVIHLIPGNFPPNIRPYRYPYSQKSEIECMVDEISDDGIIRPRHSYAYPRFLLCTSGNGTQGGIME